MDKATRGQIDGIAPEHRRWFGRLHRLMLEDHPGAAVVFSYQIPAYGVSSRRLCLGAWKHGVSIYGRRRGCGAGFTSRHPGLKAGKRTIQLRP
jgi:hypothetical protein